MTTDTFQRKLTAILSADVVGYSRLMGDDEAATVKTLEAYKGVMFSLIKQHRGRVVDSPGDNLLAEFGSVVDAVQCAVSIQKELQTRNSDLPEDRRMEFRIGINLGDVIEEDDRIYGDGVNIAARLEALADPGGICISKTAFDHIESKLPLGYEFLGDQTVKNIAKPVGAYKVLMETRVIDAKTKRGAKAVFFGGKKAVLSLGIIVILAIAGILYWNFYHLGPSIEPASVERMEYPLPDKPSIAVLPFTNMSGDPEQDYIGDGLSENIISALSVSSQVFVIARNTTFTYKGKPVKVQQVAEDLGIQYVLEGSVQKSGDRLRVTAQLIDALSGYHLWSNVYDREMKSFFDLQDEITREVMVSLQVELTHLGEDARVIMKPTDSLEALKHHVKANELFNNYVEEDNAKAREHIETALELDPQYLPPITLLGFTHLNDAIWGWSDSPSASLNRAFELAQKALELNDQDPFGHGLLGYVFLYQRQYERAIFEGKRAITLSPNLSYAYGWLGEILSYCGPFDEAISMMNKAYRLNPNLHPYNYDIFARSYIYLERYEEALGACKKIEEHAVTGSYLEYISKIYFSWIYQELGREKEAQVYMEKALKVSPDLSLEWVKTAWPYKNQAHVQRALDALRKAGMPEKTSGTVQEKPSIAVLPFDNLSSDPEQEYFVLGLSEEILNSISKISGLHVTSKTSSFAFKATDKTIKEIAEILERDYILEGSVRKAGDSLRITAQLIDVADDRHLWSETYNRELTDIFKIQEDIANNVADKLKLTLEALKSLGGTENIEAYELYLISKGLRSTNVAMTRKALESIDAAIDLDPEFALAWAEKAHKHYILSLFGPYSHFVAEKDDALKAAQTSIELEPNLVEGYMYLAYFKTAKKEWIEAESDYQRAQELIDESLSGGHSFNFYLATGKLKRAYELLERMRRNDPFNQIIVSNYYVIYMLLGDRQRAEEEYQRRNKSLLKGYTDWHDDAITEVRLYSGDALSRNEIVSSDPVHIAIKEYLDSPEEGLMELRRIYSSDDNLSFHDLLKIASWSRYFGYSEFAMEVIDRLSRIDASLGPHLWYPTMREVRQLPRFKEYVREIGLVDYWKEYGWPDLCRPVGDDDFVCD